MNHKLIIAQTTTILALALCGGCGDGNLSPTVKKEEGKTFVKKEEVVSLTPAEQAEVDKYIQRHGRDAIVYYLKETRDTNERILKYVKYLTSQGADVNAETSGGTTPLRYAVVNDHVELVKFLVSKGANVSEGLHYSVKKGDIELVKFFVSKGADVSKGLHYSVEKGDIELVKFFVSKGADVNGILCYSDNVEVVNFLILKGANINAKTFEGDTPLHFSVKRDSVEIVKFFVDKGADINAKGRNGFTPLHYAILFGNIEVFKFLVSKGADVNARDSDGKTPAHYGNDEIRKFLESKGGAGAETQIREPGRTRAR